MLVKQIANLFALMDLFVRVKQPLSVKDIVEEFGWPRSSAFNLISTLVELGYLYQPVARGGYYPTNRWLDMAREFTESQPLPESVHGLLETIKELTGETVFLAAPEGSSVVFLDVEESSADIRFIANIGQRLPIHVTAAGRAILAQYSTKERGALLNRIKYQAYEKDTYMSAEDVERDVLRGIKLGWHENQGIYAPGVAGLAVPFAFRGRRNSIALGGPVSRIQPKRKALAAMLGEAVSDFIQNNE